MHRLHTKYTLNNASIFGEINKVHYSETSVSLIYYMASHFSTWQSSLNTAVCKLLVLVAFKVYLFNSMTSKTCLKSRIRTFPNLHITNSDHLSYLNNLVSDVKFIILSYFRNKSWALLLLYYMSVPKTEKTQFCTTHIGKNGEFK
jgi:hypothetical protein